MGKGNAIANAIAALRGEITSRQDEIAALVAQRQAIADACPARVDLFAAIDARLEADAARYRRAVTQALDTLGQQPLTVDSRLSASNESYDIDLLSLAAGVHGRGTGEAASALGLALLLGDLLRENLHRQVEHWLEGKEEGMALAPRRLELARLDGIIETKRQELSALITEAAAAGVVLAA
jgi:hypothetical protein